MFDLGPGEVADVDQTLYAVLEFSKHTEVGDIANGSLLGAADGIFLADALPGIGGELFQAEGHLAGLAVKGKDDCLDLVTDLEEFLSAVKPRGP